MVWLMEGRAPSKMQELRCFHTIQGTSRDAEVRPLSVVLGTFYLASCHQSNKEVVVVVGAEQGRRSQAIVSC
jgi:hypothetical protein